MDPGLLTGVASVPSRTIIALGYLNFCRSLHFSDFLPTKPVRNLPITTHWSEGKYAGQSRKDFSLWRRKAIAFSCPVRINGVVVPLQAVCYQGHTEGSRKGLKLNNSFKSGKSIAESQFE